jgi:RHS repeat-associated protein
MTARAALTALAVVSSLVSSVRAQVPEWSGGGFPSGDAAGLMSGLANAPEANLFVGGVTTAVPIDLPPARNGMTPQIALTYSSAGGPSRYGYGWDLTLGRVVHRTKYGILSCSREEERNEYVLVLPGRTVEFRFDEATGRGLPHAEEDLFRITLHPNNYWEVWAQGRRYQFGNGANSRSGNYVGSPLQWGCGNHLLSPNSTYAWELTRVEDQNQNYTEVTYASLPNEYGPHPDRVRYGGNLQSFWPPFEVEFIWEERPSDDAIRNSLGGFLGRLVKRLSKIKVNHAGSVVRSYRFWYDGYQGTTPLRAGRQSFLSAVAQYGGDLDEPGTPSTPATLFDYQENLLDAATLKGFGVAQRVPRSLSGTEGTHARRATADPAQHTVRDILDVNGDGFPDWVDTQPLNDLSLANCNVSSPGTWNVYLGSKEGFSTTAVPWSVPDRSVMCVLRQERTDSQTGTRYADRATIDLTGDGIPDYVDATMAASTGKWRVYPGSFDVDDGGGFNQPVDWAGPAGAVTETRGGQARFGYANGVLSTRDLLDLNGDGLLDYVSTTGNDGEPWTVWINLGDRFTQGFTFEASFGGLSYTANRNLILATRDLNHDGLPEHLVATGIRQSSSNPQLPSFDIWNVHLFDGKRIGGTVEEWSVPVLAGDRWGLQYADTGNDVRRDFFDVNGDGLPDVVDTDGWSNSNRFWKVVLNRGADFSPDILYWPAPFGAIRDRGTSQTYKDTFDIDGDGMLDFVDFQSDPNSILLHHNAAGAWCATVDGQNCSDAPAAGVMANPDGLRPDLLVTVENGLGGTTALEYRPSTQWTNTLLPFNLWTVTRIAADDGMCDELGVCVTGGNHRVERNFTYAHGQFDGIRREFLGFRQVWTRDMDPAERDLLVAQGLDPGPLRATEAVYAQDGARRGKLRILREYADTAQTQLLRTEVNTWECADPVTGAPISCLSDRVWIRLGGTEIHEGSPATRHVFTSALAWARCPDGRFNGAAAHRRSGDLMAGNGWVHAHTEYACGDANGFYYVKPSHVWIQGSDADGNSDPVKKRQEQWFVYDGRGNLSATESWIDAPGVATPSCSAAPDRQCVRTSAAYDAFGNVEEVTDANGRTTRISYDPETRSYPYEITLPLHPDNPELQHKVATRYDPVCGTLLWRTIRYQGPQDPESASIPKYRSKYDSFCRLKATANPDQNVDGAASDLDGPDQIFFYHLGEQGRPTRVRVYSREPHAPSGVGGFLVEGASLFDALGRTVQTKRPVLVDGGHASHASDTIEYDFRGNARKVHPAFTDDTVGGYTPPPPGPAVTLEYDVFGRITSVTNPDGTHREIDHSVAGQTTVKDECYASPAAGCPGGKVVEVRDAFDRVVEKQLYEVESLKSRIRYGYDELGRLLTTEQGDATSWNGNTRITITYDSLGRKISMVDPDSGSWLYGYDRVGNLLYEDDPKTSQHLQYCYDALDRATAECQPGFDFESQPTYFACNETCGNRVSYAYDDPIVPYGVGRLTSVDDLSGATSFVEYDVRGRLLEEHKTIDGTPPLEAATRYRYDVADHLVEVVYPGGELVTYGYDAVGQVRSMTGSGAYLTNVTYDLFGRPGQITHGNGVVDSIDYYGADQQSRLKQLTTQAPGGVTLQNLNYTAYHKTGALAAITDAGSSGSLSNTATYGYDGLGRLTAVNGSPTYGYGALDNLQSMDGATLTYWVGKPHQLSAASGKAIQHDLNGNRSTKQNQDYNYFFDGRDQLVDISGSVMSHRVNLRYDYSGRPVAKLLYGLIDLASTTKYIGDLAEVTDGFLTKYYYAAGMLIASRREAAPATLAAAPVDPAVQIAWVAGGNPVVLLRGDVGWSMLLAVAAVVSLLLIAPWRAKRSAGVVVVRKGHVLLVILLWMHGTLPVPVILRPLTTSTSWAGGGGGGGPAPTPTPAPPGGTGALGVKHYHLDHLGSTQAMTNADGSIYKQIRYKPYGEVRGHYNGAGNSLADDCRGDRYCREFTGYETEPVSGLQYAGARFYDPKLASFLSHDPAREFASPYTYVGWNPVNFVDPTGAEACFRGLGYPWESPCVPEPSPAFGPPPFGAAGPTQTSGRRTDIQIVPVTNPLAPCQRPGGCTFELGGGGGNPGRDAPSQQRPSPPREVARPPAPAPSPILRAIPVIGDAIVLVHPGSTWWERGLAGVFLVGAVTGVGAVVGVGRGVASGVKFGQASVRNTFAHGPFSGHTIGEVASALRAGRISPDRIPIEIVIANGETIALNNRSLLALRRAGLEPTRVINRTGDPGAQRLLAAHLRGGSPSDFIRVRGLGPTASLIE